LFPIGTTQVNCSATDVYGNTAHASFNVTENPGTTPPTISGISNITDTTANPSGSTETYNPTATDEYGQPVNVSCTPTSGSLFPIGTIQVNCTATDAYNNTANESFNVTETLSAAPPPVHLPPSGPSEQLSSLSLSYSTAPCPADQVTVNASSGEGTSIRLLLTSPYGGLVDQQATGSDGTAAFTLTQNGTYEADASKSGYRPESTTFNFTTCAIAPPANITPPPPQTHMACVNEACVQVQGAGNNSCASDSDCVIAPPVIPQPVNQSMLAANQSINNAESVINQAQAQGKDVSAAESELVQAQAAFAAGDYPQATALANQAMQLALAAHGLTAAQPAVQQPPAKGFDWLPLIILAVVVIIVVAWYLLLGKKKKR
jgi:hypothetical protein